jgi:hypothetical protein
VKYFCSGGETIFKPFTQKAFGINSTEEGLANQLSKPGLERRMRARREAGRSEGG